MGVSGREESSARTAEPCRSRPGPALNASSLLIVMAVAGCGAQDGKHGSRSSEPRTIRSRARAHGRVNVRRRRKFTDEPERKAEREEHRLKELWSESTSARQREPGLPCRRHAGAGPPRSVSRRKRVRPVRAAPGEVKRARRAADRVDVRSLRAGDDPRVRSVCAFQASIRSSRFRPSLHSVDHGSQPLRGAGSISDLDRPGIVSDRAARRARRGARHHRRRSLAKTSGSRAGIASAPREARPSAFGDETPELRLVEQRVMRCPFSRRRLISISLSPASFPPPEACWAGPRTTTLVRADGRAPPQRWPPACRACRLHCALLRVPDGSRRAPLSVRKRTPTCSSAGGWRSASIISSALVALADAPPIQR